MSKRIKELIINEYRERFDGVDSACLVSLVGLDGVSTNRLRGELRSKNIRIRVLQNRLARRAFSGGPLEPLAQGFEGSCAIVHGGECIMEVAQILVEAAKKDYTALSLLTGIIEGDDELVPVKQLAKLKSKRELVGEAAMLVLSPSRAVAGALAGAGGRIAGCLKAMAEKEE